MLHIHVHVHRSAITTTYMYMYNVYLLYLILYHTLACLVWDISDSLLLFNSMWETVKAHCSLTAQRALLLPCQHGTCTCTTYVYFHRQSNVLDSLTVRKEPEVSVIHHSVVGFIVAIQ